MKKTSPKFNISHTKNSPDENKIPALNKPIPPEIWNHIIANINDSRTLKSASLVCKDWHIFAKNYYYKFRVRLRYGPLHTFALTHDGQLYAWGENSKGQLGLGKLAPANIFRPRQVDVAKLGIIKEIYPVGEQTYLLADSGKLYACGANFFNALRITKREHLMNMPNEPRYAGISFYGQFSKMQEKKPEDVNLDFLGADSIERFYPGKSHLLLLSHSGKLYAWGLNDCGQLGVGKTQFNKVNTPHAIKLSKYGITSVKSIHLGDKHTLCLTHDGKLFAWGENTFGNLGIGIQAGKHLDTPQQVDPNDFNNESIKAIYTTYRQTFLVTHSGNLYCWGDNSAGQLGLGHSAGKIVAKPSVLNLKSLGIDSIQAIYPSKYHTFILTKSNKVFVCGDYYGFQRSNEPLSTREFTPKLINLKELGQQDIYAIYPRENSTLLETKTGKLYAWGNNASGQLGLGKCVDDFMKTPTLINTHDNRAQKAESSSSKCCLS